MRVTQSMITRSLLDSINQLRTSMDNIQTSIATGKEIRKASDDPQSYLQGTRFREAISRNNQYLKNIDNAKSWIQETLTALDDVRSFVVDAKSTGIQGADISNRGTRSTLANTVDQIIEDVVATANKSYLGRNLFAGSLTQDVTPFDWDGTSVTYNGNTTTLTRQIGESLNVEINVTGSQLESTGLFSSLVELRDALQADDTDAINTAIGNLGDAADGITSLSTALGSILNQLDLSQQHLEAANVNLQGYLSKIEDTDVAEAITHYNNREIAYQAALMTTSRAMKLNIMEFIK
ncbi:MAG: flagellar hook-associated protein 3 [Candidatus Neomarinimicrobiota bacterium]|nr:MAG: flagellar hook-associated protein 3 [Candidatus Neomarinimicrobiota bacterium]